MRRRLVVVAAAGLMLLAAWPTRQPPPRPVRPPAAPPLVVLVPPTPQARRRITIVHRRLIHRSAPEPELPPRDLPPPPARVRPRAAEPAVPAVLQALWRCPGTGPVVVGGTAVRLFLAQPGEALPTSAAPLVVAAAAGDSPAAPGWIRLVADDPLYRRPHDIRGWWRSSAAPPAWARRTAGQTVALWLPPAVRAGWEARAPAALAAWDNAVARLAPTGPSR